jgi:hypothetical protein
LAAAAAAAAGQDLQELFIAAGELPASLAALLPKVLVAFGSRPRNEIMIDVRKVNRQQEQATKKLEAAAVAAVL